MSPDVEPIYKDIGNKIKAFRSRRPDGSLRNPRITQEDLAKRVGIKRTTLTQMEAGKQRFSLHLLYALCYTLEVEIHDVMPQVSIKVMGQTLASLFRERTPLEERGAPSDFMEEVFQG